MNGKPDKEWDAGDLGCGELVLELGRQLKDLQGGQVLKLFARDLGALEDLPAWCKLTGHNLLKSAHPEYWIQKKSKG
jgi:tRNA 2-thiouridine synthesizing protein A